MGEGTRSKIELGWNQSMEPKYGKVCWYPQLLYYLFDCGSVSELRECWTTGAVLLLVLILLLFDCGSVSELRECGTAGHLITND